MKLYKVFCVILIILLSDRVLAEWELITKGQTTGDEFYVDVNQIKVVDNYRYYWVLKNYPRKDEFGSSSSTMYFQADCDVFRQKVLAFNFYTGHMQTGIVDTQEPDPSLANWRYPAPGTVFFRTLEAACK